MPGGEGQRFMGYTVFDSLVFWDLSRADAPSRLVPKLATAWQVDPAETTRWIFRIRPGVRFHDGGPFTAHAAQWNFEKILDQGAPHFDPRQSAQGRSRIPTVAKATALSDEILEVRTRTPDALLPYGIAWIVMSSPAQWERVGRSWDAFLNAPSGTGPFRCTAWSVRERAVLEPNRDDRNEARRLLAEAGISPRSPLVTRVMIPAQGSGMMQPLTMNKAIQQNLREVGIQVQFEVVEWNVLTNAWRAGAKDPLSRGVSAHNNSCFSQDPFTALIRPLDSGLVTPRGTNWGWYQDQSMDALFERIRTGFAGEAVDEAAAAAHTKIVDEALFLFVAHDLNPRAMSPRVRGFVQARNWFRDLSPVNVA